MARRPIITQDQFDRLLAWLDDDRERAGKKYESIRQSLIKIFIWRGCREAEDLTDEVINRITAKIHELTENYTGDPALYFHGVAKKLILENLRQEKLQVPLPDVQSAESDPLSEEVNAAERRYECLKQCMQELSPDNREIIMAYYMNDKQAKIDERKVLAQRIEVSVNTLRVRMHRIRATLEQCINRCLEQSE
jgi:RNA polymerase sigma factor (sigma-70 family)